MQKVLTVRLLVKDDGSVAIERAAKGIDRLGRESDEAAASTRRLTSEQQRQASAASGAASSLGRVASIIGGLVGAGTLGLLVRETYQYNQQLESTRIGIAGLLNANREYLGTQDQWGAALAESADLMQRIQEESLKTKATVPQLGDAFATTFGAATAAGLRTTNAEILTMTTRLTQVGNAFGVPMEQMRQEINSLVGGMVTEDSLIARRLGFDSKSVKEMQRNGTFVAELIQRTESYAKAAEAQSNTLSGKLLNTKEIIVSTFSRGLDASFQGLKVHLDRVFGWFKTHGEEVVSWMQRAVGGVEKITSTVGAWTSKNGELLGSLVALGAVTLVAAKSIGLIETAFTLATGAGGKFMLTALAIVAVWEITRKLAPIEIGGHSVAGYFSYFATTLVGALWHANQTATNMIVVLADSIKALFASVLVSVSSKVEQFGKLIKSSTIAGWGKEARSFWEGVVDSAGPDHDAMKKHLDEIRGWVEEAQGIALGTTELPSIPDMAADALKGIIGQVKSYLPAAEDTGKKLMQALFPSIASGPGAGAGGGSSQYDPKKFRDSIDKLFDRDAFAKDLHSRGFREGVVTEYVTAAIDMQRRAEEGRLDVIDDSLRRERDQRLAQNQREYEAAVERNRKEFADHEELLEQLEKAKKDADKEAIRRYEAAIGEQKRLQREQLVGTKEWAQKMANEIGSVPDQVTRLIGESKLQLAGFFDDILSNVVSGQKKLSDSLKDLVKGLGQTWSRMLSDMLAKTILTGTSIVTQLKQVWSNLNMASSPMDAGLQGAGLGSFVGSMFQGPNNYAGIGGTIGGGLGAVIGAWFANPALGAAIGSAIGTAVGSMFQKGEDSITVAIVNGIATVTEKGISAETRNDLQTQIQRRVKEQMKGWQSIIDLFPENVKAALKNWKPTLNLTGGVESADITDEGAMNVLSDFLGNRMPKAAYEAYKGGLEIAMRTMGVQQKMLDAVFARWGELQGAELQDAVRTYFTTMFEAIEIRDLLSGDPATMRAEAQRRTGMTSLGGMTEVQGQMATLVASAMKLTDIDDLVAAQGQINQIARQYYEMGIARLQRIDAIEQNILQTNANIREQIKLAGMDDQGKIDHYYARLGELRGQLQGAESEEEVARISQLMQQYIQQAFGLAPDNQENRDKLTAILSDIDVLSSEQLQQEREKQAALDEQMLKLQQQQLEALLGIQGALAPDKRRSGRGPSRPDLGGGTTDPPGNPHDPLNPDTNSTFQAIAEMQARYDEGVRALVSEVKTSSPKPEEFAAAVARALEGARFQIPDGVTIDMGPTLGAVQANFTREVILRLQNDPNSLIPRTNP